MTTPAPESNWSEYARLVLGELERLNKSEERLAEQAIVLARDLLLYKQETAKRIEDMEKRQDRIDDDQNDKSVVSRLRELEDADLGELTIRRYRWAIIAGGIGILSSIILPAVGLIISLRG